MKKRSMTSTFGMVKCADNGGCGPCACECHTDVEIPGPHIATCKFSDPDYAPPDFARRVAAASAETRRDIFGKLR